MGQYYYILTKKDNKHKVYDRSTLKINKEKEYTMAKLMEHSWIGNSCMSSFSNIIYKNPTRIAWVGDYADGLSEDTNINNLSLKEIKKLHKRVYDDRTKAHSLNYHPLSVKYLKLVNWTKKEYIEMYDYIENNTIDGWCIHPLSLLTALGNGLGGGDYHGINEDKVGSWCFDEISFEPYDIEQRLKDENFTEVKHSFIEDYMLSHKDEIFVVQLEYSYETENGIETYFYKTKEKALEKFNELLKIEKTETWANSAYDENGNLDKENYELDENLNEYDHHIWWNIQTKEDYSTHTSLELKTEKLQ